jgi:predicted N-acetyltransferase YhbS
MAITYHLDRRPSPAQVTKLYLSAGLRRPTDDPARMAQLCEHANLMASAWDGEQLVGLARSLTDFAWCCYLADLAVHADYKKQGIGTRLIELTKERVGEQSMVLLLSVTTAMDYYPKVGMQPVTNGFILHRS